MGPYLFLPPLQHACAQLCWVSAIKKEGFLDVMCLGGGIGAGGRSSILPWRVRWGWCQRGATACPHAPPSPFAFILSCDGFPEEQPGTALPKVAGHDKRSRATICPGHRGRRPWWVSVPSACGSLGPVSPCTGRRTRPVAPREGWAPLVRHGYHVRCPLGSMADQGDSWAMP